MKDKGRSLGPSITENLIFRDVTIDDLSAIYSIYSDRKVMRFDQGEPFKNEKEAEEWIRAFQQSHQSHNTIGWGVELKKENKMIGTCGFKNWDRFSHHAEIGGNLSSTYWNNHYGTEILRFMLGYGFNKMHLNKIYAYTNVKNGSVLTLMEKYKFQQEGKLHEHQLLNGVFEDVFIFSLLKKEYFHHQDC